MGFSKKHIRKEVLKQKGSFSEDDLNRYSKAIWQKIESLQAFQKSKIILAYWSMKGEVHSHDFLERWKNVKTVLLPVIQGENLLLKQYTGEDNMVMGPLFKVKEPVGGYFSNNQPIDMVIVPGIAFDKQLNRLGRGKGYYDRFLKGTKAYKIGLCFPFQLYESIPVDEYDIKMDEVIST